MSRVAIIIPSPNATGAGGAERVMARVANGLAGRGFDVDFIVHQPHPFWGECIHPPVRLIVFRGLNRALVKIPFARGLWWTSPIIDYVRRNRPDVVIGSLYFGHRCALIADLLFPNLGTAITVNNNPSDVVAGERNWYLRLVQRLTFRYASKLDAVITIGDDMSERMTEAYPRTAGVINRIHDPYDLDDIREKAKEPVDHPWLAPDRDAPVVLSVGRLVNQKDLPTLIKAVATAPGNLRLIVLGDGPELPRLRALVGRLSMGHRVHFVGYKANPYPYYASADVFAVSSVHEGLCGTLVEALTLGTPVVSTDCPVGPGEVLEGGALGRLVPVGDYVAMGKALVDEIANPTATGEARMRSAERFAVDAVIDRYEELVRRLCATS